MPYVIGLLLVVIVVGLIGLPLVRREEADEEEAPWNSEEDGGLEKEKENVFTALNELEYDYQMRKISEEDYRALKARLTREAVLILQEEEAGEGEELKDIELAIEKEIERELSAQEASPRDPAETPVQAPRPERASRKARGAGKTSARPCPACGAEPLAAGQKFCHLCGGKLG